VVAEQLQLQEILQEPNSYLVNLDYSFKSEVKMKKRFLAFALILGGTSLLLFHPDSRSPQQHLTQAFGKQARCLQEGTFSTDPKTGLCIPMKAGM
jgi:hypothetical protein